MTLKYKSEQLKAIYESMLPLYQNGLISESEMQEFKENCLLKEDKKQKKRFRHIIKVKPSRQRIRLAKAG